MMLFHRTDEPAQIVADGFKSTSERRPDGRVVEGVWLSRRPLNHDECDARALMAIEIPDDVVAPYEVDDGKEEYREYCIPAEIVNRYGPPRVVSPLTR